MRSLRVLPVVCFGWFLVSAAIANDWTRFRGTNGAGQSDADNIPAKWTEEAYHWRTALPGKGHSSVVFWDTKAFLMSADEGGLKRHAVCLDTKTGKILWQLEFSATSHSRHRLNSYASSTPAVDADHVYICWSTPDETHVMALNHDGEQVWHQDLGPFVGGHGFGTSPIVVQDLLILSSQQQGQQLDEGQQPGKSFVYALDRKMGDIRWKSPRPSTRVSYAAPCLYEPSGGEPQLICCGSYDGFFALDLTTGKEKWGLSVFDKRTVSSPVVAGDMLFGSTGSGGGGNYVVAVRLGEEPKEIYRVRQQAPYVPTLVTHDDLAFLWSDKGIVTCINAESGDVVWRERLGGTFWGSPIRIADRIYCMSAEGEAVVIRASADFELLARNDLGEPSHSTPAVHDGRLYLRTESHLISLGGGTQ